MRFARYLSFYFFCSPAGRKRETLVFKEGRKKFVKVFVPIGERGRQRRGGGGGVEGTGLNETELKQLRNRVFGESEREKRKDRHKHGA